MDSRQQNISNQAHLFLQQKAKRLYMQEQMIMHLTQTHTTLTQTSIIRKAHGMMQRQGCIHLVHLGNLLIPL